MDIALPAIPAKRYFTIGEVSDLCGVKAYVLRYWEQEFTQLRPMKRRGNRRYYQHHEVLLIRRIRELLYEEGFTISGARNRLAESMSTRRSSGAQAPGAAVLQGEGHAVAEGEALNVQGDHLSQSGPHPRVATPERLDQAVETVAGAGPMGKEGTDALLCELKAIRRLLED